MADSQIIVQTFHQETVIRDSQSGSHWQVEIHKVTTDGSGNATVNTYLKYIKACPLGLKGTSKQASMPALNIDAIGAKDADTRKFSIPFLGDNSQDYYVTLYGYYEGD